MMNDFTGLGRALLLLVCAADDAGEAAEGDVVAAGGFILYCT